MCSKEICFQFVCRSLFSVVCFVARENFSPTESAGKHDAGGKRRKPVMSSYTRYARTETNGENFKTRPKKQLLLNKENSCHSLNIDRHKRIELESRRATEVEGDRA